MRPMLAVEADDLDLLPYPLLASYKMDGIRIVTTDDGPRTRSLKKIPNHYLRKMFDDLPVGLDGEVGVVENNAVNFRETTSSVMSFDLEPDIRYFVFDVWNLDKPYADRLEKLRRMNLPDWVTFVDQTQVGSKDEVRELFEKALSHGHEGLILRRSDAPYKYGRSTLKEGYLLKVKPWKDAEAVIVDLLPEYQNTNEKEIDNLGLSKRSTKKAGKVQKNRMGKMVVQSPLWGKTFEIGTGFTHADRSEFWQDREKLIGKLVRFGYVDAGGYDVPRHCVFQGFRSELDI